jgi:hypothetical protein
MCLALMTFAETYIPGDIALYTIKTCMSSQGKDINSVCTNFHGAVRKVLDKVGKMYNHTGWTARNLNLNLTSLLVKLFQLNRCSITVINILIQDL